MCLLLGFRFAVTGAALFVPPALGLAQAGGLGGAGHGGVSGHGAAIHSSRPGIGVGAYAPGQGPTGAASWNGGNWRGYVNAYGPIGAGGYYGGLSGEGGYYAYGGGAEVLTYNHYDNRRRDGGFYGGGGVFYGDDGYSRINAIRPHDDGVMGASRAFASEPQYRANPHIIYLPEDRGAYGCPSEHESKRR